MFTPEDIIEDATFQKFLKKKNGITDSTVKAYISSIGSFCKFVKKTPTEIHDLHKSDLLKRTPEFNMWLADALDNYVDYLVNLNHKKHGISKTVTRIKGFYHAFKLKPTPSVEISLPDEDEDPNYWLTIEDIRKAIKHANPMYQTIFTIQAQTGLAISDALSLDVKDFIEAVSSKEEQITVQEAIRRVKNDKNIIGCFDMRRKKTRNKFYTFIGPEALKSIALYLETKPSEELSSNMPLFLKDTVRLPKDMRKKEYNKEEIRLNTTAAQSYVSRMNKKENIFPKAEDGNYFRTHKIRKWYSNQLRLTDLKWEDIKFLMGQRTGDVLERYINVNNYNKLKSNYRKALPNLAINDNLVLEENHEAIQSLSNELNMYKEDSEKKELKIAELEKKQDLLENMLKNLMEKNYLKKK